MSLTPEQEPREAPRRMLAWVAGVLAAAVLVLGGAFLLGYSRLFTPEGAVAVLPLTGEDGAPISAPPLPGMLVLFASDLATTEEIDMRFRRAATREGMATLRRAAEANGEIRFVLDGRARMAGSRLRLDLRLTDIRSGAEVWSDTLEAEPPDMFPALKESGRRAAFLIRRNTAFRHGRSEPTDGQAAALARDLLGTATWFADVTDARTWADVTRLHEMAEGLEPTDATIVAHLAGRYARAYLDGYARDEKGLERAADLLARAIAAEASNPEVLLARCHVRQARREYEEALEACRAALARDPGMARAAIEIGDALLELARPDEAMGWYRRAAGMPSVGPDVRFAQRGIAVAHFLGGDYEQAIHWMGQAVAAQPADPVARGWLAALLALAGRPTDAQAEAARFFALPGDGVRRAGDLPRVHLVAAEYDGRNALIQNALGKLRMVGRQPAR